MSLSTSYANYTAAQCFGLPPDAQVACSGQHLNITDPARCASCATGGGVPAHRSIAAAAAAAAVLPAPVAGLLQARSPVPLATLCSIYDYEHYPFLWEPITCMLSNVTYSNRVNILGGFASSARARNCCCCC